jgi:hypothetical protein
MKEIELRKRKHLNVSSVFAHRSWVFRRIRWFSTTTTSKGL